MASLESLAMPGHGSPTAPQVTTGTLSVCALGPTRYGDGVALQTALVHARAEGRTGDWVLYPDHPPVLTIGRDPSPGNVIADAVTLARLGIEVHEVTRGGDVTWHGPGQLVGYPIVHLDCVDRDLHRWLRTLEEAILATLAAYGIRGERSAGRTGVWVGDDKIASIGVAVRRWVGYHGFALNVSPDLAGFDLIHPCGLRGVRMTSMTKLLGDRAPELAEVRETMTRELAQRIGYQRVTQSPAAAVLRLAGIGPTIIASKQAEPVAIEPRNEEDEHGDSHGSR